jgi:hypothetical protein
MGKRIIQIKLVILAILTLFMFNQCGNPYRPKPTELTFTSEEQQGGSLTTLDSVDAFEDSVYQITRARCVSCHDSQNPTHASSDVKQAHDIVVNQFKVNFSNVASSRLVAKLRDEAHNCWSDCTDNANEMQEAIQKWANAVDAIEENLENDNSTNDNNGSGNTNEGFIVVPGLSSQAAFEQSVYPVTKIRCTTCHINTFPRQANSDKTIAHNDLVNGGKIDFTNTLNSRIVQKLVTDEHNCWSNNCADDATVMKSAIDQWNALMEDTLIPDPNAGSGSASTEPMTTIESASVSQIVSGTSLNIVNINATSGSISSPLFVVGGSAGYVQIPEGLAFNTNVNSTTAGSATYSFNIPASGTYKMSAVTESPTNNRNSMYIKIDNENYFDWHIPVSSTFTNYVVTRTSGQADKSWNLTAGNHTLSIKRREAGVKYKDIKFFIGSGNDALAPGTGYLEYDISEILGVSEQVIFRAKIKDYDEFSYQIWDTEIISSTLNIKVKNIKTLINGYYNPQNSAFTIVDTIITPEMSSVSPYYLLALKDKGNGLDRISFKFEVLEVSN